jgi:hypothetical protein
MEVLKLSPIVPVSGVSIDHNSLFLNDNKTHLAMFEVISPPGTPAGNE